MTVRSQSSPRRMRRVSVVSPKGEAAEASAPASPPLVRIDLWDLAKFAIPYALALTGFFILLWSQQQSSIKNEQEMTAKVAEFQQAKEARGERLVVVETQIKALQETVNEQRADIKEILKRLPERR